MRGCVRVRLAVGCAALGVAAAAGLTSSTPVFAQAVPVLGSEPLGRHLVQRGESLFMLAARYGMPVTDLASLNATNPDAFLLPGTAIRVPLEPAAGANATNPEAPSEAWSRTFGARLAESSSRVAADDPPRPNLRTMAVDPSVSASDLRPLQESAPAEAGRPTPTEGTYSVVFGDTLTSIAERFGTTAGNLARLNGLSGEAIYAGQLLIVPSPGTGVVGRGGAKRIEVDVSDQRMYVWEGEVLVWNWPASTGIAGYPTRRGTFAVQSKISDAWSTAWQLSMPNWLGIYWAGSSENGIHALPVVNGQRIWGGYLGTPISYGCVVIDTDASALLFEWAEIGTPVIIRD